MMPKVVMVIGSTTSKKQETKIKMHELIITHIKQSKWYKLCVQRGYDLPNFEKLTDQGLLNCYNFAINWEDANEHI